MTSEELRLEESRHREAHWKRWGPYLSERQWGTVREDYSPDGDAWNSFPHDHARSRAYRWGEDGIGGISDRHQFICFALALWNGRDPFLKERLFGLNGKEGNHGEDVKECFFYLDSTPTHSYMRMLYKYPQAEFPYRKLLEENASRGRLDPEYELVDTGVFDESRYFDVFVEYAKASVEDILIRVHAYNRGPETAELHLLPTLWFRNTWSWGRDARRPRVDRFESSRGTAVVKVSHDYYGTRWLVCEGAPELLFTDNATNAEHLFRTENLTPYVKDGVDEYVVQGRHEAVNPEGTGTKVAAHCKFKIEQGGDVMLRLRLTDNPPTARMFDVRFDGVFDERRSEAGEFYSHRLGKCVSADAANVQRQAFAGLLWSKQFYHYVVSTWLEGDPAFPAPPPERRQGRNHLWAHLYNADVISMPDKWEYPWYAAWDLAFHCVSLALVDPDFAKEQLILLLREWYMHPNGQLPAYEWGLDDVNPPLHAWAALRVYKIERRVRGRADRDFLERVFHKLVLNFTWWVNRKDSQGNNIFEGGFLGLDNIGLFDRSKPLPGGGWLEQSDGTSWMAMYTLNLLAMAMELAHDNPVYEDLASKFFEHFVRIAHAMNHMGGGESLWDEDDGFYYDALRLPDNTYHRLKVRSMVGLIPLFAVQTLEPEVVQKLPGFQRRMRWFMENVPELGRHIASSQKSAAGDRLLLSVVDRERLPRILGYMLDEEEFLSPFGIRSLSRFHRDHPYTLSLNGNEHRVDYEPGEATTPLFGGNSNWRGPVWFPLNFLIIESLQKFHHYFGNELRVEFPSGSGKTKTLWDVAADLSRRLIRIFLRDGEGHRPANGNNGRFREDPHWRDLILFYEYFHGESGAGLGASHQTGWTALVAKLLEQSGE